MRARGSLFWCVDIMLVIASTVISILHSALSRSSSRSDDNRLSCPRSRPRSLIVIMHLQEAAAAAAPVAGGATENHISTSTQGSLPRYTFITPRFLEIILLATGRETSVPFALWATMALLGCAVVPGVSWRALVTRSHIAVLLLAYGRTTG